MNPDVTSGGEAKVAKIASLVFVLFVPTKFALDLQLPGGVSYTVYTGLLARVINILVAAVVQLVPGRRGASQETPVLRRSTG